MRREEWGEKKPAELGVSRGGCGGQEPCPPPRSEELSRRPCHKWVGGIYIYFTLCVVFVLFVLRGESGGQVGLFSVPFSSLSSHRQLLAQVLCVLLRFSFALDLDCSFQHFPAPSSTSQHLPQLMRSASCSLIGGSLLVSCFLIGRLVIQGGFLFF